MMKSPTKRTKSIRTLLASTLFLNFLHNAVCLGGVETLSSSSSSSGRIRGSDQNSRSRIRKHPIRSIYGPDNAAVRDEIHKLETESNQYWRTGIRGNHTFTVDYVDHPFDPERRRRLQNGNENSENKMQPMRMYAHTDALDLQINGANSQKIAFIKNEILPRMISFWSEALSVVPVSGNLRISSGDLISGYCGDSEFSAVPDEHLYQGVPDSDIVLYISGTPSSRFCGPTTLAVAVACNWDQYDRPTAGAINFCVEQVNVDSSGSAHPSVIEDNVDVAIHEAGHVLGMSSNSYRYFWDPETGKERTPRPIKASSVTCVNGQTKMAYIPNENTLQFIDHEQGYRSAVIVTKKVKTVARNQFNCQDLEGAQLENQPTGNSCTGDHWDERLFYPESLSGVISPSTNVLSPLTLALMEDSGWYAANYNKAAMSPWGHNAGCDFVRKPCLQIQNGQTVVPEFGRGYFCTKASERGCSPTHSYKMACFFRDYGVSSYADSPPSYFQYFTNPTLGGLKTADYCPVFGDNYKSNVHDLDCRDPENGDGVDWQGLGETFGTNSSCFESTRGEGICYNTQCIYSEFVLKVQMQGTWYTCNRDFEEIEIPSTVSSVLGRKIICPRLSSVCPDMFCPANCAGRGTCRFDGVEGGDERPYCECFDTTDTSPGCTASLVLDGKYIDDSSGLVNVNVEGFFDDLVAVFVDDPQTWNTASWCWASGLFGVFLILLLCICSTFWPKNRGRQNRRDYMRPPPRRTTRSRDGERRRRTKSRGNGSPKRPSQMRPLNLN